MSLIVVASVVVVALILFATVVAVSRVARARAEEARRDFPDARHIEPGALFFGQLSRRAAQPRGNGTLILDADEVIFKQWVVDREFRIPYRSIQKIETPRSFLGKSQGVRLLRIDYRDESGADDAMAWRVRDLDTATRILGEARA